MKTLHQWIIGLLCFSLGLSPNMVFATRGPCVTKQPNPTSSGRFSCFKGTCQGTIVEYKPYKRCAGTSESEDCFYNSQPVVISISYNATTTQTQAQAAAEQAAVDAVDNSLAKCIAASAIDTGLFTWLLGPLAGTVVGVGCAITCAVAYNNTMEALDRCQFRSCSKGTGSPSYANECT